MRRAILLLLSLIFVSFVLALPARADKRVALVIGNSAYQSVVALPNPANDAADIASALKALGFEVIEGHDLNQVDLVATIRHFSEALPGADAGLFSTRATACRSEAQIISSQSTLSSRMRAISLSRRSNSISCLSSLSARPAPRLCFSMLAETTRWRRCLHALWAPARSTSGGAWRASTPAREPLLVAHRTNSRQGHRHAVQPAQVTRARAQWAFLTGRAAE